MIDFGSLWQTDDYQQYQNPHQSAFGGLLRTLDPMTYIPEVNMLANKAHDAGEAAVTGINTALSPVVKGVNKVLETTTPGIKQMHESNFMGTGDINRFIENKPFDAAALAAATFFSGGALSGAMGGAGGAGAGAAGAGTAAGTGGTAAGMGATQAAGLSALTPAAFTAGEAAFAAPATAGAASGLGAAGSAAATQALTPAAMASLAPSSSTLAGAGLGATGQAAAAQALTPAAFTSGQTAFASTPASTLFSQAAKTGLLDSVKPFAKAALKGKRYYGNFSNQGMPDSEELKSHMDAAKLAEMILNGGQQDAQTDKIRRLAGYMGMVGNDQFMGRGQG